MHRWLLVAVAGSLTAVVCVGVVAACSSGSDASPAATPPCTSEGGADAELRIEKQGSFFVGGRDITLGCDGGAPDGGDSGVDAGCVDVPPVTFTTPSGPVTLDQSGTYRVEGTYVHFQVPAGGRPTPMLLLPGATLTGAVYESTPDGRDGWSTHFLRGGRTVYLVDLPGTGRANWARTPQVWSDPAAFFPKSFLWANFRFGLPEGYSEDPAARKPHEGLQFPIETFDTFALGSGVWWSNAPERTRAGIQNAIEKIGPLILLAHSAISQTAIDITVARPDLVKALVLIEPTGGGVIAGADLPKVKGVPMLFVYGDFGNTNIERLFEGTSQSLIDAIKAAGGDATYLELPATGIKGNSHMMMLDKNNADVAHLIEDWLAKKSF